MKCKECNDLFSPYYDGELEGAKATEFIEHLRSCGTCKQEFARYTESLSALKSLTDELEVPGMALSVRKAVSSSSEDRAARWHRIVTSDIMVVSEMLRPAKGGLIFLATIAAAALFAVILVYSLLPAAPETRLPTPAARNELPESPGPKPIIGHEATQEGMVRIEGQWLTKEDAFARMLAEKGYAQHEDWFLPEEDATRLAMGLVPHEDTWLTPEELARRMEPAESAPLAAVEPAQAEPASAPETPKESPEPVVAQEPKKVESPQTVAPPVPANEVASFLATVIPDEMESHEGLTVFSLARQEKEWEGKGSFYVTLADAVERGLAEIHETGTVSRLLVKKKPGITLFSVGGGIVIGGWQNRLFGPDVVLSSETTEANIDVYCAEQGRWKGASTFKVADYLAVADLRKKSYSGEEQDYVWKSIKELRKSQGVYSSSSSLHKLYEKRAIKKKIAAFEKSFASLKSSIRNKPHTVGVAALVGGRIVGADLFVNNELLTRHFDQLVRTYAVEAALLEAGEEEFAEDEMRNNLSSFIACAARSSYVSSGSTSHLEYRITDAQSDLYGYALSADSVPVHVSLFADGTGLKELRVVSRPPRPVRKTRDAPAGDEMETPRSKALSVDEAAAVKRRRDGKTESVPRAHPTPKPKALPVPPGNGKSPGSRMIAPRLPGHFGR